MDDKELRDAARAAVPSVVISMTKLAISPETSATNRLKAAELLLRVARSGDPSASDACQALHRARPALEKVAGTHQSTRIVLKAARMLKAIGELPGQ